MATGFGGVLADVMWMTSMLGYAIVAIGLSGCRRRRLGELDTQAHAAPDQAARICAAHGLPGLLATIEEMRQ